MSHIIYIYAYKPPADYILNCKPAKWTGWLKKKKIKFKHGVRGSFPGQAVYLMSFGKNLSFPCGSEFDIDRQICLIKSELSGSTVKKKLIGRLFSFGVYFIKHISFKKTSGFV